MPSGIQPGDLLCFFVACSNATPITNTTGWTAGSGNSDPPYWKRATGSDATPILNPSAEAFGIIVAFRGIVSTGNPFGTIQTVNTASMSASATFNPITTIYTSEYVVAMCYYQYNSDITGWTAWSGPATIQLTAQYQNLSSVSDGIALYTLPAQVPAGTTVPSETANIVSWGSSTYEWMTYGYFTLIPGP
jgi:hypothetical protein